VVGLFRGAPVPLMLHFAVGGMQQVWILGGGAWATFCA